MESFILTKSQRKVSRHVELNKDLLNIKSSYLQEYQQFFKRCPQIHENWILKSLIQNSEVKMYQDCGHKIPYKGFRVVSIKSTNSSQIYQISVSMFPFYTTFSVLIQNAPTPLIGYNIFAEGSYGLIYLAYNELQEKAFIIKSLCIKEQAELSLAIFNTLKQYTISAIMSALRIGPKLTKDFGFDIMIYSANIQFTMEFCKKVKFHKSGRQQLINNLSIMHRLNLVHLDIKPQNIAYSSSHKKWVFLDFGLSELIDKPIGISIKTGYIGSFQFSSPQMRKCLHEPGYVDLYYNDAFGLQKCLQYFQNQYKRQIQINYSSSISYQINSESISLEIIMADQKKILLKYFLYKQNQDRAKKMLSSFHGIIEPQHLKFLEQFTPTAFLKDFYYRYIYQKIVNQNVKEELNDRFKKFLKFSQKSFQQNYANRNIQKMKEILYQLATNCEDQSLKNIQQTYKNYKKIISNKKLIISLEKQIYLSIFFKYITFQQNKYQATLKDKQDVAKEFVNFFQIQIQNYFDFEISQPELLQLIICLKYILDYCQQKPYNQTKIQLYPNVCAEYALINTDIFTKKHPKNYVCQWYQTVYEQNSQNFLRMVLKCFKIKQAFKFIWHQYRQLYIQEYKKANIAFALADVWSNKQYLWKNLKSFNLIQQFFELIQMDCEINGVMCKNSNTQFDHFKNLVINNPNLTKIQKSHFLLKISTEIAFRFLQTNKSQEKLQWIFQQINTHTLNEGLIQLCLYSGEINDLINCKQIFRLIDSIINCQIISAKLLMTGRLYVEYFFNNREKAVDYFEVQINKITQYQVINQNFYLQLIKFSSILMSQRDNIKYEDSVKLQKINEKILCLNMTLIQKIKLCIQNLIKKIQNQSNQISNFYNYFKLFSYLCISIKYFIQTKNLQKQYFYQKFDQMGQFLFQELMKSHFYSSFSLKHELTIIKSIKLFQNSKFLQILIYLSKQISDSIAENTYEFCESKSLGPLLLFVKVFYHIKSQPFMNNDLYFDGTKIQKEFESQDNSQSILLFNDPLYVKKITNLYNLTVEKLYSFFVRTGNFSQTFVYNSPNYQIFMHLYKNSNFENLINYIYSFTKYISGAPNPLKINLLVGNLSLFQTDIKQFSNQFKQAFLSSNYHKIDAWENPYWWLVTSIFVIWLDNCQKRHILKIAKSFSYLLFQGKRQILQTFYANVLKNMIRQKNLVQYFKKINKITIQVSSRKMLHLLRLHYKYFLARKIDICELQLIKINQIKCKQKYLQTKIKQCIRKKIVAFHKQVGNI